jgi:hypothetical protein
MTIIHTDDHGRNYYIDGQAVTEAAVIRDWRYLWLRKRNAFRILGYKPIRVYISDRA